MRWARTDETRATAAQRSAKLTALRSRNGPAAFLEELLAKDIAPATVGIRRLFHHMAEPAVPASRPGFAATPPPWHRGARMVRNQVDIKSKPPSGSMHRISKYLCGSALVIASTTCMAEEPILLSKAEVEQFLPGKELGFHRRGDNAFMTWTFRSDGWVFLRIPGMYSDTGHWRVDDEGRFCMDFQGVVRSGCRHLARIGSAYAFIEGSSTVLFSSVR